MGAENQKPTHSKLLQFIRPHYLCLFVYPVRSHPASRFIQACNEHPSHHTKISALAPSQYFRVCGMYVSQIIRISKSINHVWWILKASTPDIDACLSQWFICSNSETASIRTSEHTLNNGTHLNYHSISWLYPITWLWTTRRDYCHCVQCVSTTFSYITISSHIVIKIMFTEAVYYSRNTTESYTM